MKGEPNYTWNFFKYFDNFYMHTLFINLLKSKEIKET